MPAMPSAAVDESVVDVLLVEDNDDDVAIVQRLVSRSPVPVRLTVVPDGAGAVEALHAALPELVLLDIGLPGHDGVEVLRRLRAQPALEDVPIIMLTGSDEDRHVRAAEQLGAHTHIVKPMRQQDFLWIMRSVRSLRLRMATLRQVAAHEGGAGC
jgi:two-component system response regulator